MFYNIFKELCDANQVKPSVAAREMGFDKSTVSAWKRNGSTPNREILTKIAEYFHVSVDELLNGLQYPVVGATRKNINKNGTTSETAKILIGKFPIEELKQKEKAAIDVVDDDLKEYLDELRNRPEQRMLFSVTKTATKAQIEAIVKMVEEMQQGK